LRARILHALRDSRGDGDRVWRVPRASVLLKKSKEWWESAFDAHYLLEYGPLFTLERDRQEGSRLIELLGLPAGSRILDVPCGQGRHAHLLAEAGFDVDGLDYSNDLLAVARKRGVGPNLRYTRGDMRKMPSRWKGRFDAVLNLFTSFGFFSHPSDDAQVIKEFARVLKPGGVLVWHGGSRDGVMARFLAKDWWTGSDQTLFAQEREFDSLSGVLTVRSTWRRGTKKGFREHRLRLYTATRLSELCQDAGLVVEQAFDGFNDRSLRRTSSEMLLVARKE
jgi:ubiquinone/menaquinone biosynthesis C-methylase UbiE